MVVQGSGEKAREFTVVLASPPPGLAEEEEAVAEERYWAALRAQLDKEAKLMSCFEAEFPTGKSLLCGRLCLFSPGNLSSLPGYPGKQCRACTKCNLHGLCQPLTSTRALARPCCAFLCVVLSSQSKRVTGDDTT